MLLQSLVFLSTLVALAKSVPTHHNSTLSTAASCFPSVGFNMPSDVPDSLDGWWCNMADEYAFIGFSYEISNCKYSMLYETLRLTMYFKAKAKINSTPSSQTLGIPSKGVMCDYTVLAITMVTSAYTHPNLHISGAYNHTATLL